jgi:hypothetical protein
MEPALRGVVVDADIAARQHRELFAELALGGLRIIGHHGGDREPICRLRIGTDERVDAASSDRGKPIAGALKGNYARRPSSPL